MNIPEGFVLVPVDSIKAIDMGWAYLDAAREAEPNKSHSFSHAGYRAMLAAAPAVDIPAYDEAKERELFESYALEILGPYFMKPKDCLTRSGSTYTYGQPATAWCAWQACAKSRARSA